MSRFDLTTGVLALGLLFLALAFVVWGTLHQQTDRLALRLWSIGAAMSALGMITIALRPDLPGWIGYELTFAAFVIAPLLRIMALRRHLDEPLRYRWHASVFLLAVASFSLLHRTGAHDVRVVYGGLVLGGLNALLGWWAWRTNRVKSSRAARLMAMAELQSAVGISIGVLWQILGGPGLEPPISSARNLLWTVSMSVATLYGTLGFLGVVMDGMRVDLVAEARRAALEAEQKAETALRREEAERHAQQLESLLRDQAQLMAEREQLLHVMAHEIRQPLHNASGVLQSLRMVDAMKALQPTELARRAGRADAVLGQVRDVLDNVLTAAVLLNRREAPRMQAVDLSFLVDMALLDLPESQRPQVRVLQLDTVGPVQLEPHLFRLSFRNLLRNAFSHGGQGVQVVVSAQRRADNGHLRITVADDGRGTHAAKLGQLQQLVSGRPAADAAAPGIAPPLGSRRGLGLGLQIVRQVVALHGGQLEITAPPAGGLAVTLDIPPGGA